jgi:tetratricopeptide (TPR) repeat protein
VDANTLQSAAETFQRAVEVDPSNPEARGLLADALARLGRDAEAAEQYSQAIRFQPYNPPYHLGLVRMLIRLQRYADAVAALEAAMEQTELVLQGKRTPHPVVLDQFAWLLATCPDDALRDCGRARGLISRALALEDEPNPLYQDTLAAAFACTGADFDAAVSRAEAAVSIARSLGVNDLADDIERRVQLYRNRQPCHNPIRWPDTRRSDQQP